MTAILVTVILGTADRSRLVGPDAAIAVGEAIVLCGLFGATLSGGSMNPARSLGPAVVSGDIDTAWIYVFGPLAGMLLAVAGNFALHGFGPRDSAELEAAQGGDRRSANE